MDDRLAEVKNPLPFAFALVVSGCGLPQPKNAEGHPLDTAMGDAAPVYGRAGQPLGKWLAGR